MVFDNTKILFGLGLIENAFDQTCKVRALLPDEIWEQEPELLKEAKGRMGRLLLDNLDVLVVDRIGKDISGDGMDPNVTGRFACAKSASGGDQHPAHRGFGPDGGQPPQCQRHRHGGRDHQAACGGHGPGCHLSQRGDVHGAGRGEDPLRGGERSDGHPAGRSDLQTRSTGNAPGSCGFRIPCIWKKLKFRRPCWGRPRRNPISRSWEALIPGLLTKMETCGDLPTRN